jgi:predicted phosphodiesterase
MCNKIGVISDAHWPFHDLRREADGTYSGAYLTAIEWLRNCGVDTLLLNGDMMDCYNLSSHEKVENNRSWKWELDAARTMVKHLRQFFGDKVRIVYREGNHEERLKRYLAQKAKELEGTIILEEMLGLHEQGIEWVDERAKVKAGKLWIDHGHEWFGGGGVNPARNYRMKAVDNVMVGHVHKTSTDLFRRPLDGTFIAGWSVGCLCDLNPRYAPRNNWNHGVALVELEAQGNFTVHNKVILQGVVR